MATTYDKIDNYVDAIVSYLNDHYASEINTLTTTNIPYIAYIPVGGYEGKPTFDMMYKTLDSWIRTNIRDAYNFSRGKKNELEVDYLDIEIGAKYILFTLFVPFALSRVMADYHDNQREINSWGTWKTKNSKWETVNCSANSASMIFWLEKQYGKKLRIFLRYPRIDEFKKYSKLSMSDFITQVKLNAIIYYDNGNSRHSQTMTLEDFKWDRMSTILAPYARIIL